MAAHVEFLLSMSIPRLEHGLGAYFEPFIVYDGFLWRPVPLSAVAPRLSVDRSLIAAAVL